MNKLFFLLLVTIHSIYSVIFISLTLQENITDFDTANLSRTKNIGENVSFENLEFIKYSNITVSNRIVHRIKILYHLLHHKILFHNYIYFITVTYMKIK